MENEMDNVVESQDIQETKKAKSVDTKKVLEYFSASIDISNNYSLDEYKKIVTNAYKDAMKKTKKKGNKSNEDGDKTENVKREPTKYNIFVKEAILKLKVENPDKPYKDLMKMAADEWNQNKLNV
jgi:hypothetical protein